MNITNTQENEQTMVGPYAGDFVKSSMKCYDDNNLFNALQGFIGREDALSEMAVFNVGTAKSIPNSSVIWYADTKHGGTNFLTGIVFKADPLTGRSQWDHVETVDFLLYNLYQLELPFIKPHAFIGQNWVLFKRSSPVIVTRCVITAMVGMHFLPEYNWVATGENIPLEYDDSLLNGLCSTAPVIFLKEPNDEPEYIKKILGLVYQTDKTPMMLDLSTIMTRTMDTTEVISRNHSAVDEQVKMLLNEKV